MSMDVIEVVVAGPQGPRGYAGTSTTSGGLTGQVLAKASDSDYDADWVYVDASDTTFTSVEGLAATNVTEAIDEVEAARALNEVDLIAVIRRGDMDYTLTTESVNNIETSGLYDVDDTNVLPAPLTSARLWVIGKVASGADKIEQRLFDTSNGKEYVRTKVFSESWADWAETPTSNRVTDINNSTAITGESGTDIDTIVTVGYYSVDTNLPGASTSASLTNTGVVDSVKIVQTVETLEEGVMYQRESLLGDGSDWTAFEILKDSATHSSGIQFEDIVGNEPSYSNGMRYYSDGTMNTMTRYSDVILKDNYHTPMEVVNNTGSTIAKGRICRHNGVTIATPPGGSATSMPQIALAQADTFNNAQVLGVAAHHIPTGSTGIIFRSGRLDDIDTSTLTPGVPAYVSPDVAGLMTNTVPPIVSQVGGVLVQDASGALEIAIDNNLAVQSTYAYLSEGSAGAVFAADNYQTLGLFTAHSNLLMPTNPTLGTIEVPTDGTYRLNCNVVMNFTAIGNANEDLFIGLFDDDTGLIKEIQGYVTKTGEAAAMYPNFLFEAVAGRRYHIEIKSSYALSGVTYSMAEFDIQSVYVR